MHIQLDRDRPLDTFVADFKYIEGWWFLFENFWQDKPWYTFTERERERDDYLGKWSKEVSFPVKMRKNQYK